MSAKIFKRKCKITYIRHGSTLYTEENRLFDEENYPPLNENGRDEMEKMAHWIKQRGLKIDEIYTSASLRSVQSARILSKVLKQDFKTIQGLHPRRSGIWNGLSFEQIEIQYPDLLEEYHQNRADFWPEGGESTTELNQRIDFVIDKIIAENPLKRILVVTHGDIIQSAIRRALNLTADYQTRIKIPTSSATQIGYFKGWEILNYSAYVPYL